MHTWPQILFIVLLSAAFGSAATSPEKGRFREFVIGATLCVVTLYFGGFFSNLGL